MQIKAHIENNKSTGIHTQWRVPKEQASGSGARILSYGTMLPTSAANLPEPYLKILECNLRAY